MSDALMPCSGRVRVSSRRHSVPARLRVPFPARIRGPAARPVPCRRTTAGPVRPQSRHTEALFFGFVSSYRQCPVSASACGTSSHGASCGISMSVCGRFRVSVRSSSYTLTQEESPAAASSTRAVITLFFILLLLGLIRHILRGLRLEPFVRIRAQHDHP